MLTISGKKKGKVLQNPWQGRKLVYLIFAMAIILGVLIAKNMLLGIGLFGGIIGLAVVVVCMLNAETGLYVNIVFFLPFPFAFPGLFSTILFPVGVGSNVLIIATFLGLFVKGYNFKKSFNEFFRAPVAKAILAIFFFILLELFNPLAHSFDGWYGAIRALLMTILLLFTSYNVFNNYRSIRRFIIVVFVFTVIAAAYGCFQQWHGLLPFELNWVSADPVRFGLIFIAGDYRKFATMSDPAGFAIVTACCAVFFLILLTGPWRAKVKWVLLPGVCLILLGMAYSGTRTANVMVLGGLVLFMILTIDKRRHDYLYDRFGLCFFAVDVRAFFGKCHDQPVPDDFFGK